eukprot:3221482-Amphidinium_carterae.1
MVPHRVTLSGGDHVYRTRAQTRSMEEAEELAMLTARLQFTEQNAYDLQRVAEYEHNIAKKSYKRAAPFIPTLNSKLVVLVLRNHKLHVRRWT